MEKKTWIRLTACLALILALAWCAALAEEPKPATPALAITGSATMERGEQLQVEVGAVEGAWRYYIYLYDAAGKARGRVISLSPGAVTLNTTLLEPGDYTVSASVVSSNGLAGEESDGLPFTVTAYTGNQSMLIRTAGSAAQYNGDSYSVGVYAPGASYILLRNETTGNRYREGGECLNYTFVNNETGTYSYRAEAYYDDGTSKSVGPATVTVRSAGKIGTLTVNAQDVIPAGQDAEIPFTFTKNPQADTDVFFVYDVFDMTISSETNGENWVTEEFFEGRDSFTIAVWDNSEEEPRQQLTPGHRYLVELIVFGKTPGYTLEYVDFYITVAPEEHGNLTLTVDGSDDECDLPTHTEAEVRINAAGATAVRFFWGDGSDAYDELTEWGQWNDPDDWGEDHENIHFTWEYWGKSDRALYAMACYDDDPWDEDSEWVISNLVWVHITAEDTLDAPRFTVKNSPVPRGDYLIVDVNSIDDRAEWCWGNVYARNPNGSINWDVEVAYSDWDPETGKICIPTQSLQPGSYLLSVGNGGPGWNDNSDDVVFIVSEGSTEQGPAWSILKPTLETLEQSNISFFAPGAERIELFAYLNGDECGRDDRFGEIIVSGWDWDRAGTVTLRAIVSYPDGEEPTEYIYADALTITSRGAMTAPVFSAFPPTLRPGQDLTFSFTGEANQTYTLSLMCPDQGWQEVWRVEDAAPGEYTVPADNMKQEDGVSYYLDIYAHKRGYDATNAGRRFLISSGASSRVTLSVNGGTEFTALSGEEIPFTVTAPGARLVLLYDGNNWGTQWRDHTDTFTEHHSFGGDDYTVMVKATWDDPEDRDLDELTWYYSNPVTLHITGRGVNKLSNPSLTLQSSVVNRGDSLNVTVGESEGATWYEVRIQNSEDGHEYFYYDPTTYGQMSLPTAMLEPGRYMLSVRADAPGREQGSSIAFFTVEGDAPDGITLTASKYDTLTGQPALITAFAPGAERIRVFEKSANDSDWRLWTEGDGEYLSESYRDDAPQQWQLYAQAMYGGAWGDVSKTITVTFTAPNKRLDSPTAALSSRTLAAGDDLTIIMQAVTNASEYILEVRDRDADGLDDRIYNISAFEPITVTIPAGHFQAEHVYVVSLRVKAPGYETNDAEYTVIAQKQSSSGIRLTVNGVSSDQNILANERFTVTAQAPASATGIAVLDHNGNWDCLEGNLYSDTWQTGDQRDFVVIARYTTDSINPDEEWWNGDIAWAGYSNAVRVTASSRGDLPAPKFTLSSHNVTQGDLLEVHITNVGDFAGYPSFGINARVCSVSDNRELVEWIEWDGEGTLLIPTASLPADEEDTFSLEVCGHSCLGYSNSNARDFFTVQPYTGGSVVFTVGVTEALTAQDYVISVLAPGATGIRLFCDRDEIRHSDGPSLFTTQNSAEEGSCVYSASVCYDDDPDDENAVWTKVAQTHTVRHSAPYGDLKASVVMPSSLAAGTPLTISWTKPADYHWSDLDIRRMDDDSRVWHAWGNSFTSYTVPVAEPGPNSSHEPLLETGTPVLEAGERYSVNLFISEIGYNAVHYRGQLLITDSSTFDSGISLTVNGQTGSLEIPVNTEVLAEIKAPKNATAILAFNGNEWEWYGGNKASANWQWGDASSRLVYAKYTTDPIPVGLSDWDELNWSGLSNLVSLTVTTQGRLPAPQFTLTSSAVTQGEFLEVKLTNVSAYAGYENVGFQAAPYYAPDSQWFGMWYDWDGKDTILVPTADLDASRYSSPFTLYVNAGGAPGYEQGQSETSFTVSEAAGSLQLYLGKNAVVTQEETTISAIAPGAQSLRLQLFHSDGSEFNSQQYDGSFFYDRMNFGGEEDTVTVRVTALYPNGNEDTRTAQIAVAAPGGNVATPVITAPCYLAEGDGLVFTVNVPDAEWFFWEVWNSSEEYLIEHEDMDMNGTFTLSLPGDHFALNNRYDIYVYAAGYGMNSQYVGTYLTVVVPPCEAEVMRLPNMLQTICEEAFCGIHTHTVVLPDGCTRIEKRAFADSDICFVDIPDSVTYIAKTAFENCTATFICSPDSAAAQYAEAHGISIRTR